MQYLKCISRLLDRNFVNKEDLDLSKEVLWVSVGQKITELPAIKVRGLKKNSVDQPCAGEAGSNLSEA